MNTTYDALIVPAQLTQPVRIERVDVDVDVLQELVGGNVESLPGPDWHVYFNDEGGRLPQNDRAEVLIREAGADLDETFKGTGVFLGHGPSGEEASAPAHLIRLAEQLFAARLQPALPSLSSARRPQSEDGEPVSAVADTSAPTPAYDAETRR
ncbi:hypothetical protein [Arthrobacter sp. B3I4]|uniref:DUF3846 domain-containing protein n=1 Tax=Arthrobacter sp. B3I4 TaxID=3042267 RepID=UPI00278AF9A0|nr:hypothetical protein [Arthrobacter sp. B3I4]MDQ0755063.1 hypothetical protein [Arthrobacter sp. B3I4]